MRLYTLTGVNNVPFRDKTKVEQTRTGSPKNRIDSLKKLVIWQTRSKRTRKVVSSQEILRIRPTTKPARTMMRIQRMAIRTKVKTAKVKTRKLVTTRPTRK